MPRIGAIITEIFLMGKRLVWCFSFVSVFALGFAAGALWRLSCDHSAQLPNCDLRSQPPNCDLRSLDDDETQIAKALEDPDFKWVHDHLTRERPMQLNVPKRHEEPANEQIPMAERPPVRFTLESESVRE